MKVVFPGGALRWQVRSLIPVESGTAVLVESGTAAESELYFCI